MKLPIPKDLCAEGRSDAQRSRDTTKRAFNAQDERPCPSDASGHSNAPLHTIRVRKVVRIDALDAIGRRSVDADVEVITDHPPSPAPVLLGRVESRGAASRIR